MATDSVSINTRCATSPEQLTPQKRRRLWIRWAFTPLLALACCLSFVAFLLIDIHSIESYLLCLASVISTGAFIILTIFVCPLSDDSGGYGAVPPMFPWRKYG